LATLCGSSQLAELGMKVEGQLFKLRLDSSEMDPEEPGSS
jgi:hypothetical protein